MASSSARRGDRGRRPVAQDEDFIYAKLEGGGGRGKPTKSPDVEYPDYPASFMPAPALSLLASSYTRASMGAPIKAAVLAEAEARPSDDRTMWDDSMLAAPKQNMVTAKISMNHKLADSSVAALCYTISHTLELQKTPATPKQLVALNMFAFAMTSDKSISKIAVDQLISSSTIGGKAMTSILAGGIELLSLGMSNLRFGDSELNTLILYAFDPNYDEGGTETPLTAGIRSAVKYLCHPSVGLVPATMVSAALSQAKEKATGTALSSSHRGP